MILVAAVGEQGLRIAKFLTGVVPRYERYTGSSPILSSFPKGKGKEGERIEIKNQSNRKTLEPYLVHTSQPRSACLSLSY